MYVCVVLEIRMSGLIKKSLCYCGWSIWEIELECCDVFRDKGQIIGKWDHFSHAVSVYGATSVAHPRSGALAVKHPYQYCSHGLPTPLSAGLLV